VLDAFASAFHDHHFAERMIRFVRYLPPPSNYPYGETDMKTKTLGRLSRKRVGRIALALAVALVARLASIRSTARPRLERGRGTNRHRDQR